MKRICTHLPILVAGLVAPTIAMAQGPGRDFSYYHGPSMMWGFAGWRDTGMVFGPLIMIALVAALVVGTVYLLRLVVPGAATSSARTDNATDPGGRALAILRERFARGEIDAAEFDERRGRLQR